MLLLKYFNNSTTNCTVHKPFTNATWPIRLKIYAVLIVSPQTINFIKHTNSGYMHSNSGLTYIISTLRVHGNFKTSLSILLWLRAFNVIYGSIDFEVHVYLTRKKSDRCKQASKGTFSLDTIIIGGQSYACRTYTGDKVLLMPAKILNCSKQHFNFFSTDGKPLGFTR
jgi:hypothetical protein